MHLNEDGSVTSGATFTLPTMDKKIFFDAEIISPRFVKVEYGEPSEELLHGGIEDSNRDYRRCYTNTESLIWDMDSSDYFKIENADFEACYFSIEEINNPERLLVQESFYKLESEYHGQNRYRYYNLLTRQFLDQTVLNFQSKITNLITSTDEQGVYKFKYATQSSYAPPQFDFVKVNENQDGSISIGDILYSVNSNSLRYSFSDSLEDGLLIFYRTAGDGLRVPYVVDLKRKKPMERPLLNDDEVDELKSDVYDATIYDGIFFYRTHFEKRKEHCRSTGPLGPQGKLLQALYSWDEEQKNAIYPFLKDLNIKKIVEGGKQLSDLLEKYSDALTPQQRDIAQRILSKNFLTYFMNEIKTEISLGKLTPEQDAIVKTADARFEMPIYYTVPENVNSNSWFIIDVHGGPHYREFNEQDMEQQFWTSRGFPYLRLNIRGSTGFGANYQNASDGNWYEVIDDVKMAIDWAKTKGLGAKAIVKGDSFGAYAAVAAYTKGYTDVAIAINGPFDLVKEMEDIKAGKTCHQNEDTLLQFGNTVDIRKANSVTTHLTHRSGTKMLLMAGLKDNNCLPQQSEFLYKQMVGLGNHVEFVTMAEEGHVPAKAENRFMILRVMEQFLGDITGHPYEPNGYGTLSTTPGVVYYRSTERPNIN
ncbi:alpha/beta hydrolase family protein [Candidatus Odyssella acanthamoebae]|uniref:Peptidase S9 prolyl oligopeptidase catalytic domain-containing protein n=1 Tax=Candidatus Odyssella acanthamoebae TaxID=91604 RepID=A0A077B058_9PROT|nr:prolyl oligopeptidase family serine peptidase [Candidatus Paracaedibacter acanthamoebae]AIK96335.1 hypothetical protein ID47_05690 [Candidatus Paracaedibacter acanthamoebae]